MVGESDLGGTGTGAVLVALGKQEAYREEAQRQLTQLSNQGERILDTLGKMREENASRNTAIEQLVSEVEGHDERITDLEKAEQQRAGAGKLGRTVERIVTALFGGAAAVAVDKMWH